MLASFNGRKDFSLTVCMLEKIGFQTGDLKQHTMATLPIAPRSETFTGHASVDLGPRLSSITPLSAMYTPFETGSQEQPSFTSMLESAITPLPAADGSHAWGRTSNSSESQGSLGQTPISFPASTDLTHQLEYSSAEKALNPYNVFANRQIADPYRPRIGSPLRYALQPEEPPRQAQDRSDYTPNITACEATYQVSDNSQTFPVSFSLPLLTQSQPNPITSTEMRESNCGRSLQRSNSLPDSPTTDHENSPSSSTDTAEDFRQLMPKRRNLPFKKMKSKQVCGKTTSNEPSKAVHGLEANGTSFRPTKSPDRAQASYRDQATSYDTPRTGQTMDGPFVDSRTGPSEDASCIQKKQTLSSIIHTSHAFEVSPSSAVTPTQPTILVADRSTLKQINDATSSLFDQYEADVARGCDETVCAKFYMDQIHTVRTECWYKSLVDMERGNYVTGL